MRVLVTTRFEVAALLGAVFAGVVTLLTGCEPAGSQTGGGMPASPVTVMTVEPRSVPAVFEYTGQTAGSREVEVRAQVTGILLQRHFPEGGHVTAGESLFTLDPAPYQAVHTREIADLASAEARLTQMKRNTARVKPLYEAKIATQKDYDDTLSNEAIAEADVKAARARVAEAKLKLDYTRVEAPITGIVGRALRSEGNYISGPEILLTTITQIDPIYVLFGISDAERRGLHQEVEAGRLRLPKNAAFKVSVKFADGSGYPHSGKLNFSDVRISETTGTSETRAALPNPEGLLHPGQFVRVILHGAQRPDAILVPQRAVLEGPKGKFVYTVSNESKAEVSPVSVGAWYNDDWIITAGLKAGDKVITDGVMKIGPGAPVQVANPSTVTPVAPAGPGSGPAAGNSARKH
ncbi:MAG: efflux RND transporter periplasmic adaptor subunit [Gammaproteobacteria bacterium]|nr:efflux RND transporter periplasmic adaptor subunit [Gammaproteobacteria bacterium]